MTQELWIKEIEKACDLYGKTLNESERSLLLSDSIEQASELEEQGLIPSTVDKRLENIFNDLREVMMHHFFRKATKGETFGNIDRIKKKYQSTLEDNYGLDSGPFLDFAKTFWTFQIEVADLFPEDYKKLASQILLKVEFDISKIFFPTPGKAMMPPQLRIVAQKKLLEAYAPEIDIDLFIKQNPILKREIVEYARTSEDRKKGIKN